MRSRTLLYLLLVSNHAQSRIEALVLCFNDFERYASKFQKLTYSCRSPAVHEVCCMIVFSKTQEAPFLICNSSLQIWSRPKNAASQGTISFAEKCFLFSKQDCYPGFHASSQGRTISYSLFLYVYFFKVLHSWLLSHSWLEMTSSSLAWNCTRLESSSGLKHCCVSTL